MVIKMKRKIMAGFLCFAMAGTSVGCGVSSASQNVAAKKEMPKETDASMNKTSVKADVKTIKNDKNIEFLGNLIFGECVDYDTNRYNFYELKDEDYMEYEGEYVNRNITIDKKQYKIKFSYCIKENQIYIANNYWESKGAEIYIHTIDNRTDTVWLEMYIQGQPSYYFLNLDTLKVKKMVDFSDLDKNTTVDEFGVSRDGKYAYAICNATKEEKEVIFFDLEKGKHYNLADKLQEEIVSVNFYGSHNIRYSIDTASGKKTYRCWNVENDEKKVIIEEADSEGIDILSDDVMLYHEDEMITVMQLTSDKKMECSQEEYQYQDMVYCKCNAENTKVLLLNSKANDKEEDIVLKSATIIDLEQDTVKEIANLDTNCKYGTELQCEWLDNTTIALVDENGISIYSLN